MKLYYANGSCSTGPLIAFHEAKIPVEIVPVDLRTKKLPDGGDFLKVNPRGAVPALGFDDGHVLTENIAIYQYIVDKAPQANLLAPAGDYARYEALKWLSFIVADVHRSFSLLFMPDTPKDYVGNVKQRLAGFLGLVDQALGERQWLAGDQYSIADIHTFVISGWAEHVQLDISGLKNLATYRERIAARPAVQEALKQGAAATA